MADSENSSDEPRVVYRGDVVIAPLDADALDEFDAAVEGLVELEEGEALYVSPHGEGAIEVQRLRKETE